MDSASADGVGYFGFGWRLGGVCEDLGLGSGVLDQRRESGVEWRAGSVLQYRGMDSDTLRKRQRV